MGNIVVLSGPQGIGKTRKSGILCKALGCSMIADDWDGKTDHQISALYITHADSFKTPAGALVIRASSESHIDELIANFESNLLPAILNIGSVELAEGERYLGAFGNAEGRIHHTILLPGDNNDANWESQMAWAKSIGGDLPTRAELVTAYETMPEEFKKDWYWSNTPHASESGWAWYQTFYDGYQDADPKGHEFRARAVRRLPI